MSSAEMTREKDYSAWEKGFVKKRNRGEAKSVALFIMEDLHYIYQLNNSNRSFYFGYKSFPKLVLNVIQKMQIGGRFHAVVVKYSLEGKLLQILEDNEGKVVKVVNEVEEKDGKL
ncbi:STRICTOSIDINE SYNTHASE 3 [Spatholobus suberectus]|nr:STRICTOSIDINE SYNTHASE 3 [Spatholobus suberectus]